MAAATDQVETPFLQLVMERLWRATVDAGRRALTLATLVELGGAQRIVETHLVDALGALAPREREIAADAFRYLVTSSRRRVVQAASDLSEWLSIPEEELVPVLEKLASGESGRILRPVPPPPGSTRKAAATRSSTTFSGSRSSNGAGSSSASANARRRLAASEHYAAGSP